MTIRRARTLSILAFGIAALTLAGCAPEAPTPAPSVTPSASPSPSASAEPTGSRPPLTELVLTTEGLGSGASGDLVLGAAPPVASPTTDLVTYVADACPGAPDPALWPANYPESDEGFGLQAPFAIGVKNGLVNRIDLNSSNIITDEGLALGSSIDAVLGIYTGGPDEVFNHADVSDVYVILGEKGKLMFEIAVDRVPGYWAPEQLDTVVALSAVSLDIPTYGVAATDNVVGVCNVA